jgi:hypothetical protein
MGYLDGSIPAPTEYVALITGVDAEQLPNPTYLQWCDQDQQLLSGLLSSLSEDIIVDVVSAKTSKEAWDILERMYSSATRARIIQVRVELAMTKKRDLSATDYFRKIKGLATEMAAAGSPLRDEEVIAYLLAGFGPDYDNFVTSMTTKTERLTLDDVYAYLMAYEARKHQHQTEMQLHLGASANYAGRGGRGDRGRDRGWTGPPFPHPPDGRTNGRGDRRGSSSRPPCQICGRGNHTTIKC